MADKRSIARRHGLPKRKAQAKYFAMVRFAAPLIDRNERKRPEAHETNVL
jgi:hypothetical protein